MATSDTSDRKRGAIASSGSASAPEVDWNREWLKAWKPHPANPWFHYQRDEHERWWRDRLPGFVSAQKQILKTDVFEEACGLPSLAPPLEGRLNVRMDVSPRILGAAAVATGPATACATDIRNLSFRASAFDVIFSPSTIDHFANAADIDTALSELYRVLRPQGRLLITLDNPANPVLWVRQRIHNRVGTTAGLIPFRLGCTLSRTQLVAALEQAGFQVLDSGYLIHASRIVGLWVGEWAARADARWLCGVLRGGFSLFERLLAALPSARLTGHFVTADCRKPSSAAVAPNGGACAETPAVRSEDPLSRATRGFRRSSQRLEVAYLTRVPRSVATRVDPSLRRVVAPLRRGLAAPLYLRQRHAVWSGRACGEPLSVATWGKRDAPRPLFKLLFDEPPVADWRQRGGLRGVLRAPGRMAEGAELLIAETTPAVAPLFRSRGAWIVPAMVRLVASTAEVLMSQERPPKTLREDLRKVRQAGFVASVRAYSPELSASFYHEYLIPHTRGRFPDQDEFPTFEWMDRTFGAGYAIAITHPERREPDALCVMIERGDTVSMVRMGVRGGRSELLRGGALVALYQATARIAAERGLAHIDAGRCLPWRTDGVTRYKWKWGFRPVQDPAETLDFAVCVFDQAGRATRRMVDQQLIVRTGDGLRVLTSEGVRGIDAPLPSLSPVIA